MKKIITFIIVIGNLLVCFSQQTNNEDIITKNDKGVVSSVEFSENTDKDELPSSANEFFEKYLDITANDSFQKVLHYSKRKDLIHDHYDQFYNGIKVDGAGYNLHYKDGKLFFANGNFVKVETINTTPSISREKAEGLFLKFKGIDKDQVINTILDLMIKEITSTDDKNLSSVPVLVYRIYLESDHQNNTEVGYVDAHSGIVVMTEPRLTHLQGTFATRYSGFESADTKPTTGGHRLFDDTRGAIIHTRNLQNNSITYSNAVELIDNNNNWQAAEYASSNNDMGLDVHWGLQKIYDHLNGTFGINSYNDAGQTINAYFRYGNSTGTRDNAGWDNTANTLVFGQGESTFKPVASLDVVGHEFGHGITDFQIGWGGTFEQNAFNEGMSDIWGVILEQQIRPHNTWKIGDQVTLNKPHLRNIQFTNDSNSLTQIADTFGSTQYNNATNYYVRSGVFSHWFYILVNGESGSNDLGTSYNVAGIGLDNAENLIVEAVFNNYLDGTTTYAAIRTAMINAAQTLFCANSLEVRAVIDAWHAVGVGNKYTGSVVNLTGPSQLCTSSTFSVNAPSGTTTTWSISPTSAATFPSGSGSSKIFTRSGSWYGNATITATIQGTGGCSSSISKSILVGATLNLTSPWMPNPNGTISVSISGGIGSYSWYKNGSLFATTGGGNNITLQFGCSGGLLKVSANTSCGQAEVTRTLNGNCQSGKMILYPNPSSSEIFIGYNEEVKAENGKSNPSITAEYPIRTEIYDFSGNLIKTSHFEKSTNIPSIDISDFKKGSFFLRIIGKEVDEVHQIIKQ